MRLYKRQNFVIPLIITCLIAIVLLITYNKWKPIEQKAYDFRFQTVESLGIGIARSQASGKVIVVGIDERSAIKDKPALFLYFDIGKFIEKMKDYEPAAIGIDIIALYRNHERLPDAVKTLYDSKINKKGEEFLAETGKRLDDSLLLQIKKTQEFIPVVQAFFVKGKEAFTPFYYGSIENMQNVYPANVALTDSGEESYDGVIRKQRTVLGIEEHGDNGKHSEKYTEQENTFAYKLYTLLAGRTSNVDSIMLNYSLLKTIPVYCFDDVMKDKISKNRLKGKAVILSYINAYEDMHITPVKNYQLPGCFSKDNGENSKNIGNLLPGPLIHAVITETLLTGTSLKEPPFAVQAAILLLLVIIGFVVSVYLRPAFAVSGAFAATAGFFIINLMLFSKGFLLHLFPHMLSPFLILTFIYPYKYFIEEKRKKKIYETFNFYMDREVIDSLLEKDKENLLKGEEKDVCIMFLDIRDFTKLSSQNSAENIVGFLNLYFGKIVEVIRNHKGFVNKFMGDGLLAFFVTEANPAAKAVESACAIIEETERFNKERIAERFVGGWSIGVGIGIHYGRVVLGNIGSKIKMDFTIIGDNVNIASRIEGLTKVSGKPLLLSDAAFRMVKDEFRLEHVGKYEVKGVDEPMNVYTVKRDEY